MTMRKLRRILHVAWNDLRIMVGDKVFFFWSLVFPMLFIVLFGLLFKASDSAPAVAELTVVNLDEGRWGTYFLGKIEAPTVELKVVTSEPAEYSRLIVLPADFSARIEAAARPGPGLQEARGRLDQGGRPCRDPALPGHRPGPQRARPLRGRRPRRSSSTATPEFRDIVQVEKPVPRKHGHGRAQRLRPLHPRDDHPVHHDDGHHLRRHHGHGGPQEGRPGPDAFLAALEGRGLPGQAPGPVAAWASSRPSSSSSSARSSSS
ncbi:MAG: ABC transporter permease [Sphingobacterium sp.]|nr:ABC transporter permease [Sphingobacterium sp.]